LNNKSIFLVVAIAATIASGVAIASTVALGVVPAVYADKDTSKNDKKQVKTWLKMEKWGNILLIRQAMVQATQTLDLA
jgi:hypothetical protein